jgi:hypothetical protein
MRDLEQVAYKQGTTQIDKTKDISLTHPSDALGYCIETEFSLNLGRIEGLKLLQALKTLWKRNIQFIKTTKITGHFF